MKKLFALLLASALALSLAACDGSEEPEPEEPAAPEIVVMPDIEVPEETQQPEEPAEPDPVPEPPAEKPPVETKPVEQPPAPAQTAAYVGSDESDKFHVPNCRWAKKINAENLISFGSSTEAESKGYAPCGTCKPK